MPPPSPPLAPLPPHPPPSVPSPPTPPPTAEALYLVGHWLSSPSAPLRDDAPVPSAGVPHDARVEANVTLLEAASSYGLGLSSAAFGYRGCIFVGSETENTPQGFQTPAASTFMAWIRGPPTARSERQVIVSMGSHQWLGIRHNLAHFKWSSTDEYEASTQVLDGQWHHVAGTISGTSLSVYVDGGLELTATLTGDPGTLPASATARIGCHDHYSNGALTLHLAEGSNVGDVRIYAAALSAEEIRSVVGGRRALTHMSPAYPQPIPWGESTTFRFLGYREFLTANATVAFAPSGSCADDALRGPAVAIGEIDTCSGMGLEVAHELVLEVSDYSEAQAAHTPLDVCFSADNVSWSTQLHMRVNATAPSTRAIVEISPIEVEWCALGATNLSVRLERALVAQATFPMMALARAGRCGIERLVEAPLSLEDASPQRDALVRLSSLRVERHAAPDAASVDGSYAICFSSTGTADWVEQPGLSIRLNAPPDGLVDGSVGWAVSSSSAIVPLRLHWSFNGPRCQRVIEDASSYASSGIVTRGHAQWHYPTGCTVGGLGIPTGAPVRDHGVFRCTTLGVAELQEARGLMCVPQDAPFTTLSSVPMSLLLYVVRPGLRRCVAASSARRRFFPLHSGPCASGFAPLSPSE